MHTTIPLEETGALSRLHRGQANGAATEAEMITVTEGGQPVLAVLSWDAYESLMETLEVLSDAEAMAAIRASNEAIAAGRGIPLETALAQLGWT